MKRATTTPAGDLESESTPKQKLSRVDANLEVVEDHNLIGDAKTSTDDAISTKKESANSDDARPEGPNSTYKSETSSEDAISTKNESANCEFEKSKHLVSDVEAKTRPESPKLNLDIAGLL